MRCFFQGDQIRRSFADWAFFYLGSFFANYRRIPIFWLLSSMAKLRIKCFFDKNGSGYILGDCCKKPSIWSPCFLYTKNSLRLLSSIRVAYQFLHLSILFIFNMESLVGAFDQISFSTKFQCIPNFNFDQISMSTKFQCRPNFNVHQISQSDKFHSQPNFNVDQISMSDKFHSRPNFNVN
jgi:hypothetical protein